MKTNNFAFTKLIIDGANVAFFKTPKNKAKIDNICIILKWLEEIRLEIPNLEVEIVADASLRYRIDDRKEYERLEKNGIIKQCPTKIEADKYIIRALRKYDGHIMVISNDQFKQYPEIFKLKYRIQMGFMILFGKFEPIFFPTEINLESFILEIEESANIPKFLQQISEL